MARSGENRAWRAALRAVLALALGAAALATPIMSQPAEAATVPIAGVRAQLSAQHGTVNDDATNCITYQPVGSATSTTFVGSGQTAITGHGFSPGTRCPTTLSTATQSAIGVSPSGVTSVQDGSPFLLSSITHYNNPISGAIAARYTGVMTLRLLGFDSAPDLVYNWTMWETPNADSPCAFPAGPNQNGCADQVTFTSGIPSQSLTKAGVTYKLVIDGFGPASAGVCPATPAASTTPSNDFLTAERATTTACIYASLVQVRSLTITKQVNAPSGTTIPKFSYSSSSTTNGSAWNAPAFTLQPPGAPSVTRELLQGENVTVSESQPGGDQWSLTSIRCVDGAGNPVPGAQYSTSTGTVSFTAGAPDTIAAGPINCTYVNTYAPKGTLTLVKTVAGGTAQPSDFTLTATGPAVVSGPGGTASVTSQRVPAGAYSLTESTNVGGYVGGNWTCTGGTQVGSTITVGDGQNVTCTVSNRFATGNFQIVKTLNAPTGAFTGAASTPFTGTYTCANGATGSFSVTTATPWASPQLPAGTTCTVTETQPAGNLANSSYTWSAPSYPSGQTATVLDQQTVNVPVINAITQQTGSASLSKQIAPRANTPASGYTGAPARTFPVQYTCVIGSQTVASGTTNVQQSGAVTLTGLPATSTCTFVEDQTAQPGDFLNASYRWDGYDVSPSSVVVPSGGSVSATVTNYFVRATATLNLAKVVSGDGYIGTGQPFAMTVDCGLGPQTVSLGAGGSTSVTVPANAACTVVEAAPAESLLAPAYDWAPPTYAGLTNGQVSVAEGAPKTVTVTNATTAVYGEVAVQKAISPSAYASAVPPAARFALTVTCNAPAQGQTANYTGTFSVPVGVPSYTPRLPVGTSCSVSEATPAQSDLVDESYAWGATPADQNVVVSASDSVETVTVTNTIIRAYGTLAIAKSVTALDGVTGSAVTFSGDWSCKYDGQPAVGGTWSVTGSGAATLTGPAGKILLGSVCSVTETTPSARPSPSDPSYIWGAQTITGPVALTAANPNGSVTVTNPVQRITGSFGVNKVVRGGAAGTAYADTDFTMTYQCVDADGAAAASGTLKVQGGQTLNAPSVPAGSTCTVTEDTSNLPAPIDPYRWNAAKTQAGYSAGVINDSDLSTTNTVTFTTPDSGAPINVRFINYIEPKLVTVTATKLIGTNAQGYVAGGSFALSLSCTQTGRSFTFGPIDATPGTPVQFDGVPVGASCEIFEAPIALDYSLVDSSYRWDREPVKDPNPLVITEAGSHSVTITNNIERVYSTFSIEKILNAPPGVVDPARQYSGTWTCTATGQSAINGTWSIAGTGVATLSGVPSEGVLLGSNCTAAEDALSAPSTDPSYAWQNPVVTNATVTADGLAQLTVTNTITRNTANVSVSKQVTGETAGYTGGDSAAFTVDATCYLNSPNDDTRILRTATVANGGTTVLLSNVPIGWTCRVAEAQPAQSLLTDASYVWGQPMYTGLDANNSVKVAADTPTIEVTNPITRVTGTLSITKMLDAATPATAVQPTAQFSGTWTCTRNDTQVAAGTWAVTGTGTATLTADPGPMPIGTSCAVTENAPSDGDLVDGSWSWNAPVVGGPVVIATGAPNVVDVTNGAHRVYSSMSITKAYAGPAGAVKPGVNLDIAWVCTFAGDQVASGVASVPATGGTVQIFAADGSITNAGAALWVPAGSSCTVAEQTLDNGDLTDPSYAWNAESYSPASGVSTVAGSTVNVTVTNDVHRSYGSLQVRKQITTPDAGLPVRTGLTFSGQLSCTNPVDPQPVVLNWTVLDQGTTTVNGIPTGSTCNVVSETAQAQTPITDDESYKWGQWTQSGPLVVTAGADDQLVVTNPVERDITELTITKQLAEGSAPVASGTTFNVSYTCTSMAGRETRTGSATLGAGQTYQTPTDIPTGSTCSVTEGTLPEVGAGYSWAPPQFAVAGILNSPVTQSGQTITFKIPAGRADSLISHPEATVTNSLRNSAITVDKKDANGADGTAANPAPMPASGTMPITFTVTNTGTEPLRDITVTDEITAGSGQVSELTCSYPDGSTGGPTWAGPLQPGAEVTCRATVSGVRPGETHVDVVTVAGVGTLTGLPAKGTDTYTGRVPEGNTPVPPTTPPPVPTTQPAAPSPKPHAGRPAPRPQLAFTGVDVDGYLHLAGWLGGFGVLLALLGRRRRLG